MSALQWQRLSLNHSDFTQFEYTAFYTLLNKSSQQQPA